MLGLSSERRRICPRFDRLRSADLPHTTVDIIGRIRQCEPKSSQALNFTLPSGARIDETLHLRSDKVFINEAWVELQGKGGQVRRIQVLHADALKTLDLSHRFVDLTGQPGRLWKDGLERRVRQARDALDIYRRGVHGFRATATCEFVTNKAALDYAERAARHELAM